MQDYSVPYANALATERQTLTGLANEVTILVNEVENTANMVVNRLLGPQPANAIESPQGTKDAPILDLMEAHLRRSLRQLTSIRESLILLDRRF